MFIFIMKILFLVIIIEAMTNVLVKGDIFTNFRSKIYNYSEFLGKLVLCGYCFSFWVSFIICFLCFSLHVQLISIFNIPFLDFIANVFILQRMSNYLHGISDRFFDTRKDIRYNKLN